MWVPLIENGEHQTAGADYFIKRDLERLFAKSDNIDTLILGCTHYPLIIDKIRENIPNGVEIISQGDIVAASLKDYLSRHKEIESRCSKGGEVEYLTTESAEKFNAAATTFLKKEINAKQITIV